jgi:mannose-6-phosphate isomerase-like protein (cupin superfamily)
MPQIQQLRELEGVPHATVFSDGEPRTIRLTLDAGERVDPHQHPGRDIVLYLVEGAMTLHLDDETFELEDGDVTRFDGEYEISPVAIEPSTALIILAPRHDADQ